MQTVLEFISSAAFEVKRRDEDISLLLDYVAKLRTEAQALREMAQGNGLDTTSIDEARKPYYWDRILQRRSA